MTRMYRCFVFLLLLFVLIAPMKSSASRISVIRKLVEISPSPSPVSPPEPEPIVKETCEMASHKCHQYETNMTACVSYPETGPQGLHLIVVNDGDTPLKVKVTILPANQSYKGIDIPKHEAKKVKIFANIKGSSFIVLNAGPAGCIIQMEARPQPNFYASYLTPTNGAVLLLAGTIIMGVMWASCKSGKESRHIDGTPYQELEMSRPESLLSSNAETKNGWDQGWDSDWDEEHAVKSPGRNGNGKRALSRQVNGINNPPRSSSNSEGWGNDWDD
ncbi:hypothetical protein LguiA_034758 [Lonicera macranthoides]